MLGRTRSADGRLLGTKCERVATIGSEGSDHVEKGCSCVGEGRTVAVDQPETASDVQFGDGDLDQFSARQLRLDGEAGNEGNAVAAGDEALDGLEAGKLDTHVEGSLMAGEGFDNALPQRGCDGVGDEVFLAEFANGDLVLFGQRVFRVDDKRDRVGIDGDGMEAGIIGAKGEYAELGGTFEDLVGDLAGEGALDGYAELRVGAAERIEHGKQPEAGVFVGGNDEAAAFEGAEFFKSRDGFAAKAEKSLGIAAQEPAGGGEGAVAGGALEQRLSDFIFELADGVTDGRLGTAHAGGGAGEALFFSNGEEGFELVKVH